MYRIKSLYDNKMAVITKRLSPRYGMTWRHRLATRETPSRTRQGISLTRIMLIREVFSTSLLMTKFLRCSRKISRLNLRLRRQHRTATWLASSTRRLFRHIRRLLRVDLATGLHRYCLMDMAITLAVATDDERKKRSMVFHRYADNVWHVFADGWFWYDHERYVKFRYNARIRTSKQGVSWKNHWQPKRNKEYLITISWYVCWIKQFYLDFNKGQAWNIVCPFCTLKIPYRILIGNLWISKYFQISFKFVLTKKNPYDRM